MWTEKLTFVLYANQPNMAFERDALKAARPSTRSSMMPSNPAPNADVRDMAALCINRTRRQRTLRDEAAQRL